MQQDLGRYTTKALEFVLQLKESIALESVTIFFQAVSKGSPTSKSFLRCRCRG